MSPVPALLAVLLLGGIVCSASAQLDIGQPASLNSIHVNITGLDEVRVVQEIAAGGFPRSLTLLDGEISDLTITDRNGEEVQHGLSESPDGSSVLVFPSGETRVSYGLGGVLGERDGVTWVWDFLYPHTTTFHLPESVDIAFVNETPVYFDKKKVLTCHGCQMVLEMVPDEKKTIERITWEDQGFDVEVWASTELGPLELDQPAKSIRYSFDDAERWVTLIIPRELLWDPYQVQVNGEKVQARSFYFDDERQGLSLKLEGSSNVSIVGASVVPEFPVIIPVMVAAMSVIILLQAKSRLSLR